MNGAAVGPFLCAVDTPVTRTTTVRRCQLPRDGHFTQVDRFRKLMGREKEGSGMSHFWETHHRYCEPPNIGGCRTVVIIMQSTWTNESAGIRKEHFQFWSTCD